MAESNIFDDAIYRVNGVCLGPSRWAVLDILRKREGRWVAPASFVQLMPRYFEHGAKATSVKTHICGIRKLLAGTPWAIESYYGKGYRLVKAP